MRTEWNAGRNLIFYLRPGSGGSYVMRHRESVTHLELASLDDVKTRGVDFRETITSADAQSRGCRSSADRHTVD
jgi:hypothetical protein